MVNFTLLKKNFFVSNTEQKCERKIIFLLLLRMITFFYIISML